MSVSVSLPQDTFVSVSDQKKFSIEYLSIVQTKYKTSFEFSRMCFTVQLSMFFVLLCRSISATSDTLSPLQLYVNRKLYFFYENFNFQKSVDFFTYSG